MLELMLGQIANFCPVISRNTIVKASTSINSIWQAIRSHFGFQATGAHFLDFSDIKLEVDERPEDLYQRLVAFTEDNLLRVGGGITHHGAAPTEDKDISPSVENIIVLTWLRLIHRDLPRLIKQRYGTELRSRTLASIKPEISQALESLLEEVRFAADLKVMRSGGPGGFQSQHSFQSRSYKPRPRQLQMSRNQRPTPMCVLCRQAGRSSDHFLSKCTFLPDNDRKFVSRARQIGAFDHTDEEDNSEESPCNQAPPNGESPIVSRVQIIRSPHIKLFFQHKPVCVTLDSGAEANMIRISHAKFLGTSITKSNQSAYQTDGKSPLVVVGETYMTFSRDNRSFTLDALVVEDLDVYVLAGTPFHDLNDITVCIAKRKVSLSYGTIYTYGIGGSASGPHAVRRTQAHLVRAPTLSTTVWPGDFLKVYIPEEFASEDALAIESRCDSCVSTRSIVNLYYGHNQISLGALVVSYEFLALHVNRRYSNTVSISVRYDQFLHQHLKSPRLVKL